MGRRRRLLRRQLRPQQRRQRQRARRPGVVLRPGKSETVTLKTIFGVNPDPDVDTDNYDGPDNMTLSPYGGIILAEDGEGIQHLVGVTDQGKSYPLGPQRPQRQRVHRPRLQRRRQGAVRQHPVARTRVRDHRALGPPQQRVRLTLPRTTTTRPRVEAPGVREPPGRRAAPCPRGCHLGGRLGRTVNSWGFVDSGRARPSGRALGLQTCAPPGTRTPNPVIKSHLLCQLS